MRSLASYISISVVLGLSGCGTSPILKQDAHIKFDPEAALPSSSIPPTVRQAPLPPPPEPRAAEVRYSVVVSNQPVRDVLLAIARETNVNVDVHPGVEGNVTLNAIDQTLKQILARISKQIDMRYEIEGQTIMVMPDSPFLKTYRIDYVNMSRDVTETVGIATQIISGSISSGGGGGGGSASSGSGDNNSTHKITSLSRNRFWESLERNIKDLLRETDKLLPEGSSETFVQGRGQNTTQGRAAVAPARRSASNAAAAAAGGAAAGTAPVDATTQQLSEFVEQKLTFREASSVIVNAESGIVTVRATGRQQERIAEFLEQVMGSARRQVLIEVTVVEVVLNDSYQSGVDWSALGVNGLGYSIRQNFLAGNPTLGAAPFFEVQYRNPNPAVGGNLASTIKLLSSFGNTKVLSSPKIMVLNNQTAVLKVVDNIVYFNVQAQTTQGTLGTPNLTTFNVTQNVVPIGFIMNVTPQISEADMVTLNVRPTVTRILSFVNDPNPAIPSTTPNRVPQTQSREMESVLKVGSGQTAILGGLMQDSFEGTRDGLPIASRIPFFGDLVSQRNDVAKKTELVIFIRPLVVKDASVLTDLAGYQRYVPGPDFFKDTRSPLPEVQEGLMKLQRGEMPGMKPNPVVPDPVPGENAK